MEEDSEFYTVLLDGDQKKYIQGFLPQGYSLVRASKIEKLITENRTTLPENSLQQSQGRAAKTKRTTATLEIGFSRAKNTREINERMRKCESILNLLMAHPFADPFMVPVNHKSLGLHDFTTKIKEPMDFTSIRLKLINRKYPNSQEFVADVRKTFANAFLYYPYHSTQYNMAAEVSEYFERLNTEILNAGYDLEDVLVANTKVRTVGNKVKELTNQKVGQFKTVSDKPMAMHEKKELQGLITGKLLIILRDES